MAITIRVPWSNSYDHGEAWNELLAWTVETYGLPGHKVSFHPTQDWMDFTFNDEQDALVFQLKTSGIRRTNDEITIDFVGSFLR